MRPSTVDQRQRLYLLARVTIARHYGHPLTLDRVAQALASSPRQLTRAYAQFSRTTFHEDLVARRMRAGARLLVERPALPVRDIARLVGYRQAPHFAKAFRRRYGLTPAAFRAEGVAYSQGSRESRRDRVKATRNAQVCCSTARVSIASPTGSAPGNRNRIAVPPPAARSAATEPPCCSATWRTIARPRPEPGRPRASAPR